MNQAKAAFFDTMATRPWAADPFPAGDRPKIDRLLTAGAIAPGAHVFEPGCGTGRLTEILAEAVGSTGRVLALDISQKMVEACRARLVRRENVEIIQAAIEEYPVAPEAFDTCVCHQAFPHFDNPTAALATCVRSLRRGGRLVVVHFANAQVINEIHRTAASPIRHDRVPPPPEMQRLLTQAGLVVDWCADDTLGYLVRGTKKCSFAGRVAG